MWRPPEPVDRLLQHLLGAGEVGDVDRMERTTESIGDLLAVRVGPVQHRHAGTPLGQRLSGRTPEARCPADDDGLLPGDRNIVAPEHLDNPGRRAGARPGAVTY